VSGTEHTPSDPTQPQQPIHPTAPQPAVGGSQEADFSAVPPSSGAPGPGSGEVLESTPRRPGRTFVVAALATGLVVGGATVVAFTHSGRDSVQLAGANASAQAGGQSLPFGDYGQQGQPAPGQALPGQGDEGTMPGGDADGGHRGAPGGPLGGLDTKGANGHGTITVPNQTGSGTRTLEVQRGAVTSVSSTQLVVKSTDGFTATYVLNAATQKLQRQSAALKAGDQVTVIAQKSGSALNALFVSDGMFGLRGMGGGRHPGGNGPGAPGPGAPGTSPTSPASPSTGTSSDTAFVL
jgi:hypothetical protein